MTVNLLTFLVVGLACLSVLLGTLASSNVTLGQDMWGLPFRHLESPSLRATLVTGTVHKWCIASGRSEARPVF